MKTLRLYTDGAARGNPGPASAGVVIEDDHGTRLRGCYRYLGEATNNVAEYQALIEGLKLVEPLKPDLLEVFLDSELVVKQINGLYKVKTAHLVPLHIEAKALLAKFPRTVVQHVVREMNHGADAMANLALDEQAARPGSSAGSPPG